MAICPHFDQGLLAPHCDGNRVGIRQRVYGRPAGRLPSAATWLAGFQEGADLPRQIPTDGRWCASNGRATATHQVALMIGRSIWRPVTPSHRDQPVPGPTPPIPDTTGPT